MNTIRRWYIYLVCALSVNVVIWAVIALGRNLLLSGLTANTLAVAFEVAVTIIGLPLFAVHWLWAQRLARAEPSERDAALRQFYLYAVQAGFLAPLLANAFGLVSVLLGIAGLGRRASISAGDAILAAVVAIVVLAALWFYHRRVAAGEATAAGEAARPMRALYAYGFAAVGFTMVALAGIHLLRWLMFAFGGDAVNRAGPLSLNLELTRVLIGLPVWLVAWLPAQRRFARSDPGERDSTIRKLYLYAVVFVSVVNVVTNLALILAGVLRRLMSLPPQGDLRLPLPIILVLAVSWAYHAWVLRRDGALAEEAPRQAGLRRLYLYLVATVGLAALLIGLAGELSVIIQAIFGRGTIRSGLGDLLAYFTAAILAGLPVWWLSWLRVQRAAAASGPAGVDERQSAIRKLYLYFFIFIATVTFLASAVFLVYQIILAVLGTSSDNTLSDLAQAVGVSTLAVGVWIYHGWCLWDDARRAHELQTARLVGLKVAVAEMGQGQLGRQLADGLKRELPGLSVELFNLTPALAGNGAAPHAFELSQAEFIVGPWLMAAPALAGEAASEAVRAIALSPARKLVAPVAWPGWEWVGADPAPDEAYARQLVEAVKRAVNGEGTRPRRALSAGAIVGIVLLVLIGVFVVLPLIVEAILMFTGNYY